MTEIGGVGGEVTESVIGDGGDWVYYLKKTFSSGFPSVSLSLHKKNYCCPFIHPFIHSFIHPLFPCYSFIIRLAEEILLGLLIPFLPYLPSSDHNPIVIVSIESRDVADGATPFCAISTSRGANGGRLEDPAA